MRSAASVLILSTLLVASRSSASPAERTTAATPALPALTQAEGLSLGLERRSVKLAGAAAASTGLLVGSGVLGFAAGAAPPMLYWNAHRRPEPLMVGTGLAVGFATAVALSQLSAPWGASLVDARAAEAARREGWRRSRWAVLGGAVGVGSFALGAGLERHRFGDGQLLMAAGLTTVLVSCLAYGVLELSGIVSALDRAR